MKKYFFFVVLAVTINSSSLDAQTWQWAQSAGGINEDYNFKISQDQSGNIYVAGTLGLPTGYFQTDTFNISGFNDFYIAKYDINGNEIWVKKFGGPNSNMTNIKSEGITDFIFDPLENCLIACGIFYETCDFGTVTLNTSINDLQMFIAKFDLNGNCLWAKAGGSSGDERGAKIATDTSGNLYVEGSFIMNGNFDTLSVEAGGFLAKFNSGGNGLWTKKIFSNPLSFLSAYDVVDLVYTNNYIFMFGFSLDSLSIDTITFTKTNYVSQILTKWNNNGDIIWANQMGGPSNNYYGSLSYDSIGNFYFSGAYNGSYAIFGSDSIFSSGSTQGYLAKYNSSGSKVWIKQIDISQNIKFYGGYCDKDGNLYSTGSISGNATFDSFNINSNTNEDLFVTRYNTNGDCLGVRHAGEGIGFDVISDGTGSAYLTGKFTNTIFFDSHSLSSLGNADIFIAKIDAITGLGGETRNSRNQLLIYANPNAGKCNITIPDEFIIETYLQLTIFDNFGKIIQQKSVEMNEGKIKLNLEAEAKGMYHVTLGNGKKSYSGKIVFE